MKKKKIFVFVVLFILLLGIYFLLNFSKKQNTETEEIIFEPIQTQKLDFKLEGEIIAKQDLNGQNFYEVSILQGETEQINEKILISEKIYEDNNKIKEYIMPDGKIHTEIEFIDYDYANNFIENFSN